MSVPDTIFGFPYGVLDPELVARPDLKMYHLGAKDGTNVVPRVGGGFDRRPGLTHVAELAAASGGCRLAAFEYSTEKAYLLAFTHQAAQVYVDGALAATVAMPYTAAQLPGLDWTQSYDTMLLFHPDVTPKRLLRQGSHSAWALSDLPFVNPPTRQYGADTTGTGTPSAKTGSITVTSTAADFAAAQVGWAVVLPTGHGEITAKASDTSVTVKLRDDLKDTTAAKPAEWAVEEPAWSAARGWPATGRFHEGRLFIGGAKAAPTSVWGSKSARYFDFDYTDENLDDDAIDMSVDDDQVNAVRSLYSADRLLLLTSGGPFFVPDSPATPSNFYGRRVSRLAVAPVRPVEVDGVVAFVAEGVHRTVCELAADAGTRDTFTSSDLAQFSASVMRGPVAMAARRGATASSAHYLYVVNGDGTVAVLHSRRAQQVTAWTLWRTDGAFLDVAVVDGTVYFLVRRTVGGQARHFIEKLDEAALGDCSSRAGAATPQTVWTGFNHFEGRTLRVVADGSVAGSFVVAGGAITLPSPAAAIEAALPFSWRIETMPPQPLANGAAVAAGPMRLHRAAVRVQDTKELWIDGRRQSFRTLPQAFATAPPPFSGVVDVRRLGWRRDPTVVLEGFDLLPATVLSVSTWNSFAT